MSEVAADALEVSLRSYREAFKRRSEIGWTQKKETEGSGVSIRTQISGFARSTQFMLLLKVHGIISSP